MRLQSITIEGFRSFREREEVDLSNITLMAITGANHSGKTSILRAIDYALFGPDHGTAKALVHRSAKSMQVTLTLLADGGTYTITRTHRASGTGHKLAVTMDGEPVATGDLNTTQAYIEELIGMGKEVSRATWMSMQGDIEKLALMDGPTRRAVFVKAFGLDRYDALAKQAKERRRDASRECDNLRGRLEGLSEALDSHPALVDMSDDELREELERHEGFERRRRLFEESNREASRVAQSREEASVHAEVAAGLDDAVKAEEIAGNAHAAAIEERKRVSEWFSDIDHETKTAAQTLSDIDRELEHAQHQSTGTCDKCGQTLTEDARRYIVDALERARSDASATHSEWVVKHTDAREQLDAAQDKEAKARAVQIDAIGAVKDCRQAAEMHDMLMKSVQASEARVSEIAAALAEPYEEPTVDADAASQELHVRDLRAKRAKMAEEVQHQLDAAETKLERLELLAEAFSPSGIPMAILHGVADEVASDANDILESMGSPLEMEIDASGTSVDIVVDDGEWQSLSGQERFFCALAQRLALGRAVARRTGSQIATMLLDEGWGALDTDHAQKAVEALAGLTEDVGILTVTHIDEVGSQMPQRIEVEASSGTSRANRL